MSLTIRAAAKINLFLEVGERRPDGYHQVVTVLQSVALYDTLTFRPRTSGISLSTSGAELPSGSENLVWRAAALAAEELGESRGVAIELEKRIPVGGGLGGGSSDAAAALRGSLQLWGRRAPPGALGRWARRLGVDVSFFLRGGTSLAVGRGDLLAAVPPLPPLWVLLATPPMSVESKEAYQGLERGLTEERADPSMLIVGLACGDVSLVSRNLHNRFEEPIFRAHPPVAGLKEVLIRGGALGALLSGTGASVFALFAEEGRARQTEQEVRRRGAAAHLVRPLGRALRVGGGKPCPA